MSPTKDSLLKKRFPERDLGNPVHDLKGRLRTVSEGPCRIGDPYGSSCDVYRTHTPSNMVRPKRNLRRDQDRCKLWRSEHSVVYIGCETHGQGMYEPHWWGGVYLSTNNTHGHRETSSRKMTDPLVNIEDVVLEVVITGIFVGCSLTSTQERRKPY